MHRKGSSECAQVSGQLGDRTRIAGQVAEVMRAHPATLEVNLDWFERQRALKLVIDQDKSSFIVAVGRSDGKVRWQKPVLKSLMESKHSLNSHASSTPMSLPGSPLKSPLLSV